MIEPLLRLCVVGGGTGQVEQVGPRVVVVTADALKVALGQGDRLHHRQAPRRVATPAGLSLIYRYCKYI